MASVYSEYEFIKVSHFSSPVQFPMQAFHWHMLTFHFLKSQNQIWINFQSMLSNGSPRAHLHLVGMLQFMGSTWTSRACPLLFILFLCLVLSYGPFNYISFHKFSQQFSAFSLCSPSLISALPVLSTIYLFVKVSLNGVCGMCGTLPNRTMTWFPVSKNWHKNK